MPNRTNKHTSRMGPTGDATAGQPGWMNAIALMIGATVTNTGHAIRYSLTATGVLGVRSQNSANFGLKAQVLGVNMNTGTTNQTFSLGYCGQITRIYVSGAVSAGQFLYLGDSTAVPAYAVTEGGIAATFRHNGRHIAFAMAGESNAAGTAYIKGLTLPWRV